MLIGVDEAGRGPVLGSMFVAAVATPDADVLPRDVADSKSIPGEVRERLATEMATDDRVCTTVVEVSVEEIDDPRSNLNELTVQAAGDALRDVTTAGRESTCVLDACDVDPDRFARRIRACVPECVSVSARHRADEDEPVVGAASIVAKSAREAHVESLAQRYGEIGSGYAHDARTRAFLESYLHECGELPACARRSWQTSADLVASAAQGTMAQFE